MMDFFGLLRSPEEEVEEEEEEEDANAHPPSLVSFPEPRIIKGSWILSLDPKAVAGLERSSSRYRVLDDEEDDSILFPRNPSKYTFL
jgi:hypothetical protein